MVDNRGVTPVSSFNFKSGDISGTAAKTSEEKNDQGTEYFAQEMYEEDGNEEKETFQDRSAQLRASLDSLAMANAGSIMLMKTLKEKKRLKEIQEKIKQKQNEEEDESVYDE